MPASLHYPNTADAEKQAKTLKNGAGRIRFNKDLGLVLFTGYPGLGPAALPPWDTDHDRLKKLIDIGFCRIS
jgi:hypothetical protein